MIDPKLIGPRLRELESQLRALNLEKEQLLQERASRERQHLSALADKVRAACNGDEELLAKVLEHMGFERISRKRHFEPEEKKRSLREERND